MRTIDEGVYIFNNWFESAKVLSGIEFKKLFLAIYNYQIHGIEPPSFTQKGEGIARNVFPCIEKRINGAIYARRGTVDKKEPDPIREPDRVKPPTLYTKEKISKEKNSIYSLEERERWQDFFDAATAHALKKMEKVDEG